jgi:HNH endonuclease
MRKRKQTISALDRRLSALNRTRRGCDYYLVVLTADEKQKAEIAMSSEWVGWADEDKRWELRRASLVNASAVISTWKALKYPFSVVHTAEEMMLFMIGGGNALVEKELAESVLSKQLKAHPCIPNGLRGFKHPEMFESSAFRRAPTPKLRMHVLKRDNRRCRICGRRPDDDVDLELHVHHVRPFSIGGVTESSNLITLCDTCHRGLEPHADYALFGYIESSLGFHSRDTGLKELLRGISNYRKLGFFGAEDQLFSGQA